MTTRTLIATLALLAAACGDDGGGSGDTDATGGINLDGPDEKLDLGGGDETGIQSLQCERIDFLFVIDNSSSMQDEQLHLVQAVPGFVDAMQNALPDVTDLRVGVVDTDSYPGLGNPNALEACPDGAPCDSCDYRLGALMTKPASAADPDTSCYFGSGMPYMNGLSDSFAAEFECAALVGIDGNPIEQQASALVEAVSPDLNAQDKGCNAAFVRDNALLVFLLITDEEDDVTDEPAPQGGSIGDPNRWYDAIVEAKGGEQRNVVALGLIGGSPRFGDCSDLSLGLDGAEQTTRLQRFFDKFTNHFTGSVCSNGYDDFFAGALDEVSEGCKFFIP